MSEKIGEVYLQSVLNYIDDWVGNIPDTLPTLQVPKTIPELVTTLGGKHSDAILRRKKTNNGNTPQMQEKRPTELEKP